jgi:transposase
MIPQDFPPWSIVYHYFRLWRIEGIWDVINTALRTELRIADGRQPEPSAAVIDSIGKSSRMKLIWADGGYAGKLIGWVAIDD